MRYAVTGYTICTLICRLEYYRIQHVCSTLQRVVSQLSLKISLGHVHWTRLGEKSRAINIYLSDDDSSHSC